MKLTKNSKVIIKDSRPLWKDKTGIILSNDIDSNNKNQEIKVKVDIGNGKFVIQTFLLNTLEATINENSEEIIVNENIKSSIHSTKDFKDYFINKSCKFNGFDYDELFSKIENDEGEIVFRDSDIEYIEYYESLKHMNCVINRCALIDTYDDSRSLEDNFKSAFWDLQFENNDILQAVSGECISINDVNWKDLNESLSKKINYDPKDCEDIIKPYLIASDLDSEYESWFFVNRIAVAENIPEYIVIEIAKKFKYKVFLINTELRQSFIVASKKITKEDIILEYAQYLPGFISVEDI